MGKKQLLKNFISDIDMLLGKLDQRTIRSPFRQQEEAAARRIHTLRDTDSTPIDKQD